MNVYEVDNFPKNQPTQSFGNEYLFFLTHVKQMRLQQVLHGYCSHRIDTCGGCAVKWTSGHQLFHHNHLLAIFRHKKILLFQTYSSSITVLKEYNSILVLCYGMLSCHHENLLIFDPAVCKNYSDH